MGLEIPPLKFKIMLVKPSELHIVCTEISRVTLAFDASSFVFQLVSRLDLSCDAQISDGKPPTVAKTGNWPLATSGGAATRLSKRAVYKYIYIYIYVEREIYIYIYI